MNAKASLLLWLHTLIGLGSDSLRGFGDLLMEQVQLLQQQADSVGLRGSKTHLGNLKKKRNKKWTLQQFTKEQLGRNDIRNKVVWVVPLVSSLVITTSWTAIIQERIPCPTHTNTSERSVHWNIWRWTKWGKSRREGRRAGTGATDRPEGTVGLRRWEESGCWHALCSPENSCLHDGHILWMNPVIGAETNMEVWQLCSSSCHCQAVNKALKAGCLPHPPRDSNRPQKKLWQWDLGNREEYLQPSKLVRVPEWQTHIAANPSNRVGVEIRRRDTWGLPVAITGRRTKPQTTSSLSKCRKHPPITADPSGGTWDTSGVWLLEQHLDFMDSECSCLPQCPTAVVPWDGGSLFKEERPNSPGNMRHFPLPSRGPRSGNSTRENKTHTHQCHLLENKTKQNISVFKG